MSECICDKKTPKDWYCSIHCGLCKQEIGEIKHESCPPLCDKCFNEVFNK